MVKRLLDEIVKKDAPIVVGLDPKLDFVPEYLVKQGIEKHGETLEAAADAILEFNKKIVDATYDLIPAVKPQIAMYEQFGVPGLKAFEETCAYCRKKGLVVIGDVKRGDIGSTSGAYATAHLGEIRVGSTKIAPFAEDYATVNPYLGSDGVQPFIDICNMYDKGIFILVKTSNPSSGEFQDQMIGDKTLYQMVADKVNEWGKSSMDGDYSNVGAVVGATYPEMGVELRKRMPHAMILVPGYGAQGGKGKDLLGFFNEDGLGAIVNSSRGIIAAYRNENYVDKFTEQEFADASRAAVLDMKEDLKQALGK